ncbi:MAG: pyridoxal-phosphate dependent enzyme, partial [Myxococcales bacterium]|nr:pyridoxal-phosphate dependent enzyme [Myxococcales bacterium]
ACGDCGGEDLDVVIAADPGCRAIVEASRDPSLWRYHPLLPVPVPDADRGPLRSLGLTPLHAAPGAAQRLSGGGEVWIKDDGALPTGSLKDRASAIVAQRAGAIGAPAIITASTGNAGVAIAAMGRAAGLDTLVLVPESAPPAKIAQLLVFGAELYLVRGSYDDAFALSREAALSMGLYCRNTAMNPFTVEGKKTVAFEICEQLTVALGPTASGHWQVPDRIYVSVGDGNIISGVHKGLKDLLALGFIAHLPRLIGVQAAGSAAIAQAFDAKSDTITPVHASTIADSIAADRPADGRRALAAVNETGGVYLTVSDEAILAAIPALGRDAAVFGEPAAAAAYAGFLQQAEAGAIPAGERVVVLNTGNGLKDVQAAARAVSGAVTIDPSPSALRRAMEGKERR